MDVGSTVGKGRGGREGGLVLSTEGGGTMMLMTEDGLLVGTLLGSSVEAIGVGAKVGNGVGASLGARVGMAVVASAVGCSVGASLGMAVAASVGDSVGISVGEGVGCSVGTSGMVHWQEQVHVVTSLPMTSTGTPVPPSSRDAGVLVSGFSPAG
jgi:hypothetical protein